MRGSDLVVQCLLDHGVRVVFGYPGAAVLSLFESLRLRADAIRFVRAAHEQGAAHAADGYARVSGRVGVCVATSGPGVTNLMTGIAAAHMDSVPVVFITGNIPSAWIGTDGFQEVDATGITMPITKHNFLVKNVDALEDALRSAFRIAASGRPGPVLVDIARDALEAVCERTFAPAAADGCAEPRAEDSAKKIRAARAILLKAKRPVILAGGGAARAGDEIRRLARRLGAPVCMTLMGLGALSPDDPYCGGLAGIHGTRAAARALCECDALIGVGTRFSERVTERLAGNAGFRLIHIDIDAAELNKNLRADVSLNMDARAALKELNAALPSEGEKPPPAYLKEPCEFNDPQGADMRAVRAGAGRGALVVTDVGNHQMRAARYIGVWQPGGLVTSGGLGAMGFGLGAAIGAALAKPDKRVVLITGDGSFCMNLTELSTLKSSGACVVIVVMNNASLGMIENMQVRERGGRAFASGMDCAPDFVKVAGAYGVCARRVDTVEKLEAAVRDAFAIGAPALIDYLCGR